MVQRGQVIFPKATQQAHGRTAIQNQVSAASWASFALCLCLPAHNLGHIHLGGEGLNSVCERRGVRRWKTPLRALNPITRHSLFPEGTSGWVRFRGPGPSWMARSRELQLQGTRLAVVQDVLSQKDSWAGVGAKDRKSSSARSPGCGRKTGPHESPSWLLEP